jgi:hypothetical protein
MFHYSNTLPNQDNSLGLEIGEFDMQSLLTPPTSMFTPYTTPDGSPFGSPSNQDQKFNGLRETQKSRSDVVRAILRRKEAFRAHGLGVAMVQWCDVDRAFGGCWGSNITDMTLMMKDTNELLPVVRFDNFNDIVYTLPAGKIAVVVGNEECGADLRTITLSNYLKNFGSLVPSIENDDLSVFDKTMDTDRGVVVRVQAVPLPKGPDGTCEFVPTAYNYQTVSANDPKNAIFVASHLGTSAQLDRPGSQPIYLHKTTDKSVMSTYFKAGTDEKNDTPKKAMVGSKSVGLTSNVVIFGQIPLKQHPESPLSFDDFEYDPFDMPVYRSISMATVNYGADVEEFGGFDDVAAKRMERDTSQPITLTVCFYYTTDGDISDEDASEMAATIKRCYQDGEWAGSLVAHKPEPDLLPEGKKMGEMPHRSKSLDKDTMNKILLRMSSSSIEEFPDDE